MNDNPGEIVINKNHILFRDNATIVLTEAYAMPSSTYVPDDSHTFFVTADKKICWANYGRCWNDKGDRIKIADQKSYQEWLNEFCPNGDYTKCGITFGVNGVCHTVTNRELLIGEDDVDVRNAAKNFVTVSIFGKYGFGLSALKQLITDAYNRANLKVMFPEGILETVLQRIDNTLEDEANAWQQLMNEYFALSLKDIIATHPDALTKLQEMIKNLLTNRENIYEEYVKNIFEHETFEKNIYNLLTSSVTNYITYLSTSNYIDITTRDTALKNATLFFNKLFKVVDGQIAEVTATGKMDEELAKK